ncbi:MAG: hypothetical protein QT08_C0010G0048 [archaeon GW2011_AR17]|nr:MAG: hypothetical protein QT08_C0010G0048 [archaeon GW2011_AR17]MBS3154334.1 hypothetical protein [Candidatus Woesearchaeota archaeon]HIH15272.1 hypothetical protein [Nanoarchaeota archaeon]HIH58573.1 hypothetical protein [Nanoarchaeota archaeon]HII13768.1 hypothetical protein [Nanoarchaeota archaeon]
MVIKKTSNDDSKTWAFLGVFLSVIGFIIVLLTKKDDQYAMYYAKHGLIIFVAWLILSLIGRIPAVGWFIYVIGGIGLLVLWVMAFIAALSGEKKKFLILTDLAEKINL